MKLDWEITGEAKEMAFNKSMVGVLTVELFLNGDSLGYMNLNLESERVGHTLDDKGEYFLEYFDVAPNFRGYKAFLGLLGIEVPELSLAHWTPEKYSKVYVIVDSEIELASSDRAEIKKACLNYNVFPGLELAERAINLSKLDRLILLWQYKNNCLFTPDWKDDDQPKHSISYNSVEDIVIIEPGYSIRQVKTYFEKREQVKTFIEMYDKEIKKIMGVI